MAGETRAVLGELAAVSRETLRKVEWIEQQGSTAIKNQAQRGEISVHHAYELLLHQVKHQHGTQSRLALHSSDSDEWYTPAKYSEVVRELLGEIDLDPASSPHANQVIQAKKFYTREADGLKQHWRGRVFLNPPYGFEGNDSNQAIWSQRLMEQYRQRTTTEAVLLVNATTDRKWFQPLWEYPICFTNHRIQFYRLNGEANQPTHGNAFIYFGQQVERFNTLFRQFGVIVTRL